LMREKGKKRMMRMMERNINSPEHTVVMGPEGGSSSGTTAPPVLESNELFEVIKSDVQQTRTTYL